MSITGGKKDAFKDICGCLKNALCMYIYVACKELMNMLTEQTKTRLKYLFIAF